METIVGGLQWLDVQAMYLFNVNLRNPFFTLIMPIFDGGKYWSLPLGMAWLSAMIFGGKRMRLVGVGAVLLICITDPIGARLFKPLIGRIRPCNVLSGINMWKDGGWIVIPDVITQVYKGSFSMPSNHAANTAGQAIWWGTAYPRQRVYFWAVSGLIGFSRIYDGVHWPGDVLGGWILAALVCIGMQQSIKRFAPRLHEIIRSPTRTIAQPYSQGN